MHVWPPEDGNENDSLRKVGIPSGKSQLGKEKLASASIVR